MITDFGELPAISQEGLLKETLSSPRFLKTAAAYRVLDMTVMHSSPLSPFFPDNLPDVGYKKDVLYHTPRDTWEDKPAIFIDANERKELEKVIDEGTDLVQRGNLFVCIYAHERWPKTEKPLVLIKGHSIRGQEFGKLPSLLDPEF